MIRNAEEARKKAVFNVSQLLEDTLNEIMCRIDTDASKGLFSTDVVEVPSQIDLEALISRLEGRGFLITDIPCHPNKLVISWHE